MKKTILLLILMASFANAATNDTLEITRMRNKAHVTDTYKLKKVANRNKPDILVLPGLEANRTTKKIDIMAEAAGLKKGETAEYFLIGENSGHDYEALAISFALPSDVRKALIFIGIEPGQSVNYKEMQFWPKGERVKMSFLKASSTISNSIPAERLVKNTKTQKTLPELGFVFTGSIEVVSATNSELKSLAADVFDPMSIVANYNEPGSILDIPRSAKQGDVYESQVISDNYSFKPGELLNIVIEPEYSDGKLRVRDFTLEAKLLSATTNTDNHLVFNLIDQEKKILTNAPLAELLEKFNKVIKSGYDPFVTINFADDLSLEAINKICSVLSVIESENGIRIEPPTKGQLYYKSFIPESYLRERKSRAPIKWELHVKSINGKVAYNLIHIDSFWKDDEITPSFKITNHKVQSGGELTKLLKSKERGIPVVLVFAQADVTYKQLTDILQPVMPIYDVVHVFVEK